MTIRRVSLPALETSAFPYAHLVLDGTYAFVSGVVASDIPGGAKTHGDIAEETRIVMTAVRDALASVGLAMDRIIRVDVHMTDLDQMPVLNEVYRRFFAEGSLPTRTCTQSAKLAGGSNVEITVIARGPS